MDQAPAPQHPQHLESQESRSGTSWILQGQRRPGCSRSLSELVEGPSQVQAQVLPTRPFPGTQDRVGGWAGGAEALVVSILSLQMWTAGREKPKDVTHTPTYHRHLHMCAYVSTCMHLHVCTCTETRMHTWAHIPTHRYTRMRLQACVHYYEETGPQQNGET